MVFQIKDRHGYRKPQAVCAVLSGDMAVVAQNDFLHDRQAQADATGILSLRPVRMRTATACW